MSDKTENYVPLVMTANGWVSGKGTTPYQTLVGRLRREWGSAHLKKYGWRIYLVHPDFEICEVNGTIYTPLGHPPVMVEDKKRIEGVRV